MYSKCIVKHVSMRNVRMLYSTAALATTGVFVFGSVPFCAILTVVVVAVGLRILRVIDVHYVDVDHEDPVIEAELLVDAQVQLVKHRQPLV